MEGGCERLCERRIVHRIRQPGDFYAAGDKSLRRLVDCAEVASKGFGSRELDQELIQLVTFVVWRMTELRVR
jgi:hypothetical protein